MLIKSCQQQTGELALVWAQRCFAAPMLVSLPNLPTQHFYLGSESDEDDEDTRTECSDPWQHGDSTPAVAADKNEEKAAALSAAMSAKAELWLLQATSSEVDATLRD